MVKSFMEELHKLQMEIDQNNIPVQWNTAVKFLMARKFDVRRALDLFRSHEVFAWNTIILSIVTLNLCSDGHVKIRWILILNGA